MFGGTHAKKEGNCNVVVTRPTITWSPTSSTYHAKILHTSTSTLLPLGSIRHRYDPSSILASTRIPPSQPSALALYGGEVLRVLMSRRRSSKNAWAQAQETTCSPTPFQIWWWWSEKSNLTLYKGKPPEGCSERWERRPAGRGRPDSRDVNISFNLGQPQSSKFSGNAKEEGLDVTLDDPAAQRTYADGSWWMVRCKCVIHLGGELRPGSLGLRRQ